MDINNDILYSKITKLKFILNPSKSIQYYSSKLLQNFDFIIELNNFSIQSTYINNKCISKYDLLYDLQLYNKFTNLQVININDDILTKLNIYYILSFLCNRNNINIITYINDDNNNKIKHGLIIKSKQLYFLDFKNIFLYLKNIKVIDLSKKSINTPYKNNMTIFELDCLNTYIKNANEHIYIIRYYCKLYDIILYY